MSHFESRIKETNHDGIRVLDIDEDFPIGHDGRELLPLDIFRMFDKGLLECPQCYVSGGDDNFTTLADSTLCRCKRCHTPFVPVVFRPFDDWSEFFNDMCWCLTATRKSQWIMLDSGQYGMAMLSRLSKEGIVPGSQIIAANPKPIQHTPIEPVSCFANEIYLLSSEVLECFSGLPVSFVNSLSRSLVKGAFTSSFDVDYEARKRDSNMEFDFNYFIRGESSGYIKIGFTSRLDDRIKREISRNAAQDIRILAVISGTRATEKQYHRRFSKLRVRGEWFRPHQSLLSFIDSLESVVEPCVVKFSN